MYGRMLCVLYVGIVCLLCFCDVNKAVKVTKSSGDAQWYMALPYLHDVLMMGCAWLVLLGRLMCSTDPS